MFKKPVKNVVKSIRMTEEKAVKLKEIAEYLDAPESFILEMALTNQLLRIEKLIAKHNDSDEVAMKLCK